MIDVDEIEDVLKLARRGEPVAHIARTREVSEPTARRYRDVGDPPPRLPHGRGPSSPTLEPFKATIDRRLEEDAETWRRQGHAAARVFARLKGEAGHTGPYPTAQRCVRARGRETAGERDRRDRRGLPELEWRPGECRAGLGEADHRARGAVTRGKCPAASSPHPDVGASQAFWGETPECACEGPKDVSESMGGVPGRVAFDNATEVGRRFGAVIHAGSLPRPFCAHHGLGHTLANPRSGSGRGSVEAEAGHARRSPFVPMPALFDAAGHDARLMGRCLETSRGRAHRGLAPFERGRRAPRASPAGVSACGVGGGEVRRAGGPYPGRNPSPLRGAGVREAGGQRRPRRHGRGPRHGGPSQPTGASGGTSPQARRAPCPS